MPRGQNTSRHKYVFLQRYLLALPPDVQEVALTFLEIKAILGTPLPRSALLPEYWTASTVAQNWPQVGFAAQLLLGSGVTEHAVRFTRLAPRRR
jgi:hypothetical protein